MTGRSMEGDPDAGGREYPWWDSERAAREIAAGGVSRVYRAVYRSNRDVFRVWGYREEHYDRVVGLGDREAFLAATKVYDSPFEAADPGKRHETVTDCVNADCAETAKVMLDCGLNPAILNLASRRHACGGYDSGAGAQEESLCRVSTLSQSLYQHFDPSLRCVREAEVAPRGNAYPLDINFGGIYSPGVTFFRHGPARGFAFRHRPFRCGVVSVAALNFRSSLRHVNEELRYRGKHGGFTLEGRGIMLNKMRTIFRIALANGHDSIVLGAFGCGAFRLHPAAVAVEFRSVLLEREFSGRFRAVVFAILEPERPPNPRLGGGKFEPFYYWFGGGKVLVRR